jgi:hypothetical protein
MANMSGLTAQEIREVEAEAHRRADRELAKFTCNCGAGHLGHSPDCSWILAAERVWDIAVEAVLSERHEDE